MSDLHIGYRNKDGTKSEPTDPQKLAEEIFLQDDTEVLLLIGDTRAAKTACGMNLLLKLGMKYPGIPAIMAHLTYKDIESALVVHLKEQVPEKWVDPETGKTHYLLANSGKDMSYTITIPPMFGEEDPETKEWHNYIHPHSGYTMKLYYRPLDPKRSLADELSHSGITAGAGLIDQFEMLDQPAYTAFFTRLSMSPRKLILTANPPKGNIKPWWHDFFIDEEKRKQFPGWEKRKVLFMSSVDNPHIDSGYREGLGNNVSKADAARFLGQKVENPKGLVYPEVTPEVVMDFTGPIPPSACILEVIDWGYVDGALCQFWVRMAEGYWLYHSGVKTQLKTPDYFAEQVVAHRVRLLSEGRKPGEPLPRFIGSPADPSIFSRQADGKSVFMQMISYKDDKGNRLTPFPINKNLNGIQKKLISQQVTATKQMFQKGLIRVNRSCENFFNQCNEYFFKPDSEEPHEPRVKGGLDGDIIHHFEEMVCLRYFGWYVNTESEFTEIEQNIAREVQDGYSMHGRTERYEPFSKFRRKMNRVA